MIGPGAGVLLLLSSNMVAQSIVPPPRPVSPVVQQLHEDAFLTDDERRQLHLHHGTWDVEDLQTPLDHARAALQMGVFDDPALADPSVPALLRARAAWRRGDRRGALDLLVDQHGPEAASLSGRVAFELGDETLCRRKLEEAMAHAGTTASREVARIRAARQLALLAGRTGATYQVILDALGTVRDEQDPMHWDALIEEVDLLVEKQRFKEAAGAGWDALELNPRLGVAWYSLGRLATRTFDFDGAEAAAEALRRLDPGHPLAAIIEAEAALVRRDIDAAREMLAVALARYPEHPDAQALLLAAAVLEGQEQLAMELAASVRTSAPGDPRPFTLVGRLLSLHRQFDAADRWLEVARDIQPLWPPAHVEQGLMQWQAGRDGDALETMRRAVELDPFNRRAANSMALLEDLEQFESLVTPHFIVRWSPGVDEALARDMPDRLEQMHEVLVERFGWAPPERTTVELYPDHRMFAVRIIGLPDIHTVAACTGPVIAMEAPRSPLGDRHLGLYDWMNVLQHEYTHTITLGRTNYRVPLWLTEGLAVFMELAPRSWNTKQLLVEEWSSGTMLEPAELDWSFIRPRRPQDRSLAYAQSWLMVEYLLSRWGMPGLDRLLDAYRDGTGEDDAFQHALDMTRQQFHEEFIEWIPGRFQAWGLVSSPSMATLLEDMSDGDRREALRSARGRASALQEGLQRALDDMGVPADSTARGKEMWPLPADAAMGPPSVEAIEELLLVHPSHPDLLYQAILHRLSQEVEMDDSMLDLLERYVEVRSADPMGHRLLAEYWLSSNPSQALEHLEALARGAGEDPQPWMQLAKLQRSLGHGDAALESAQRAAMINPYDPVLRERIAALAIETGAIAVARHQVEALLHLEPGQPAHERRLQAIDALLER